MSTNASNTIASVNSNIDMTNVCLSNGAEANISSTGFVMAGGFLPLGDDSTVNISSNVITDTASVSLSIPLKPNARVTFGFGEKWKDVLLHYKALVAEYGLIKLENQPSNSDHDTVPSDPGPASLTRSDDGAAIIITSDCCDADIAAITISVPLKSGAVVDVTRPKQWRKVADDVRAYASVYGLLIMPLPGRNDSHSG
ncbi:hypothetical protein K490DRAFT_64304 [Saccharata proteae CBS 121410]|uniref:Uncharacterized protein n=1 Tax=Saccharata proteae CBS 121410 TaxID=1314787 RepID=A0A6A5YCM3_9PEZI|nr:hypothetical protein K490DRAFT_64304 [Saccharata proteae CBS 121410]